jgi:hypothetical protein
MCVQKASSSSFLACCVHLASSSSFWFTFEASSVETNMFCISGAWGVWSIYQMGVLLDFANTDMYTSQSELPKGAHIRSYIPKYVHSWHHYVGNVSRILTNLYTLGHSYRPSTKAIDTHAHTHPRARTRMRTHTHAHAHTRTHTHTRIRTRTRTSTCATGWKSLKNLCQEACMRNGLCP